jgi:hypothetical protein
LSEFKEVVVKANTDMVITYVRTVRMCDVERRNEFVCFLGFYWWWFSLHKKMHKRETVPEASSVAVSSAEAVTSSKFPPF